MIDNIEHLKDSVLKACLAFKDSELHENSEWIHVSVLHERFLSELEHDLVVMVVKEIFKGSEDVLSIKAGSWDLHDLRIYLSPNGFTKNFIKSGGFSKLKEDREYQEFKQRRKELVEQDLMEQQLQINEQIRLLNTEAIKNVKQSRVMYWVSIMGAVAAWAAVVVQVILGAWN